MHAHTQIPATENTAWGFWGTLGEQAEAAWPLAMTAIAAATGKWLTRLPFQASELKA